MKGYHYSTGNGTWHAVGKHMDEGKKLLEKKYGAKGHQKKGGNQSPAHKNLTLDGAVSKRAGSKKRMCDFCGGKRPLLRQVPKTPCRGKAEEQE